jgi:HEAT repeat protein
MFPPSTAATYPSPLDRLLNMGEPPSINDWPDYVTQYGLTEHHVPELIRMATDAALHGYDGDDPLVWAPIHAWRALGQLNASAAIQPLITLLRRIDDEDDDWVGEEMPRVFGMIGPAAIEPLTAYLADNANPQYARIAARGGLVNIAQIFPDHRDRVAAFLADQLSRGTPEDACANGFLVSALIDLKAVEHKLVIEQAHARQCVDLSICGDWDDVQVELGLKSPPKILSTLTRAKLLDAIDGVV